jgi:hypothetical protein
LQKFLGVGLKTAVLLWIFFVLMTVFMKTLATKYDLPGESIILAV